MKKNTLKAFLSGASLAMLVGLGACSSTPKIDPYDLDFSVDTRGTTIQFWTPFGGDNQDFVDVMVEKFEEETGIHVEADTKSSYDGLRDAISLAATYRTYPHVAMAYPDHMATYVNADIILRMDYFLENDGDDDFKISDFYQDYVIENQSVEFKEDGTGYTLGLPFNKSTEVLCYNKTFFDWAALSDPAIQVPSTWEELAVVAPKIRAFLQPYFGKLIGSDYNAYASSMDIPAGVKVIMDFQSATDANFFPFTYDSQANFFITAVRQWGGTYTTVDPSTRKGHIAFDSSETVAALSYLQQLYNNRAIAIPDSYGGTSKYNSAYFVNGQSVMTVGSSAGVKNSVSKSFETAVAPTLYHAADKKFVISQGTNIVLLDQGTMAERVAAWKLVKFLTKYDNGFFCSKTSYFPSCPYAAASEDYQDRVEETRTSPSHDSIVWYGANKVNDDYYLADSQHWTKFTDPPFVGSSTVRDELDTSMSQLFIDKLTPQALINKLYDALKDYR